MGKPYNYDDIAENYALTRSAVGFIVESLTKHISILPSGSIILEAGCGTGDHIIELSGKFPANLYKGFDLSPKMLDVARSRSRIVEFLQGNAEVSFPYQNNICDLTFFVNVIHHIVDLNACLNETFRVLRPGGFILIYTDSEDTIRKRSLTKFFPEVMQVELNRYPKIEELNRSAKDAGLILIEEENLEGCMELNDENINKFERKCSSSLRLIPDERHKEGMQRLREAGLRGEKYFSYYVKLAYVKPLT